MVPFNVRRDRRPSVFMWPISASMALRPAEVRDQHRRQSTAGAADQPTVLAFTMAAIVAVDGG